MLLGVIYSKTKVKLQIINVAAVLFSLAKSEVEEHFCVKSKTDRTSLPNFIFLMPANLILPQDSLAKL
jgi:hypothetical protein